MIVWGGDNTTALPVLNEEVRSENFAWVAGRTYLTSTTHIANRCAAVELALGRGCGGKVCSFLARRVHASLSAIPRYAEMPNPFNA
jgi:hypothetical protein